MSETNGAMVLAGTPAAVEQQEYFTAKQVELIKRQIAPRASNDELMLFLYQCKRTGLDPFSRQIYALERREKNGNDWSTKMSIMTGIDGLRLIAERTGRYCPGPETTFEYDNGGNLRKATAYVLKLVAGTWHTVAASAIYSEYVGLTRENKPTKMWAEKPHIMLGKCAEALALRKAFPAEMSGLYTSEEMSKAVEAAPPPAEYTPPKGASPATAGSAGRQATTGTAPSAADSPPSNDTGEAPTDDELDKLESRVFDGLKWKKPHAANWLRKYFETDNPGGLTRVQVADAMALLDAYEAAAKAGDDAIYDAKVEELRKAGRIAPAKEGA
jgi:phage recombination protein Bet